MQVMVTLAPFTPGEAAAWATAAEAAGVDVVGFGDSPARLDPWVALTLAASATSRIRLATAVTSVVTRHPLVTAQALRSLDLLAPGRVIGGFGAGDSALAATGLAAPGPRVLADGLGQVRSAWPGPLLVATNGPRTIDAVGPVADVVVTGTGIDEQTVRRTRERVHAAESEHWVVARVAVNPDPARARRDLLPLLASGANHVFTVPAERALLDPELGERVDALRAGYDYRFHGMGGDTPNTRLVGSLGLTEFLLDRFAVAGTAEQVTAGLIRLARRGVRGVVIPAVGFDPLPLLRDLGSTVLPALREAMRSGSALQSSGSAVAPSGSGDEPRADSADGAAW